MTEKIAYREGVGDTLAEGVDRVHEELGVGNYTVKGLEFAAHDGRVLHGQGLSYAVANRGADHMYGGMLSLEYEGELDPEGTSGKAERLVHEENRRVIRDSGVVCAFASGYVTNDRLATLLETEYDHLLEIGARTVARERHFNNQRGKDRGSDGLPYAEEVPDLDASIAEYYEARSWNADGTVPDEALDAISESAVGARAITDD